MATALLKYDITDSDEAMAFMRCVKSTEMAMCLWEIKYNIKKKLQYQLDGKDAPDTSYDALDDFFEKINEIFEEHNINMDELIM